MVEDDFDRYALDDFHIIARRVLRRKHGEGLAGSALDRLNVSGEPHPGIGVDLDVHRLAGAHVGELSLLEVRGDPDIVRHDGHQFLALRDVVAQRNGLVGDMATERGDNLSVLNL